MREDVGERKCVMRDVDVRGNVGWNVGKIEFWMGWSRCIYARCICSMSLVCCEMWRYVGDEEVRRESGQSISPVPAISRWRGVGHGHVCSCIMPSRSMSHDELTRCRVGCVHIRQHRESSGGSTCQVGHGKRWMAELRAEPRWLIFLRWRVDG